MERKASSYGILVLSRASTAEADRPAPVGTLGNCNARIYGLPAVPGPCLRVSLLRGAQRLLVLLLLPLLLRPPEPAGYRMPRQAIGFVRVGMLLDIYVSHDNGWQIKQETRFQSASGVDYATGDVCRALQAAKRRWRPSRTCSWRVEWEACAWLVA